MPSRIRPPPALTRSDGHHARPRRAGRSIIITSNRAPADWYPLFPNPVVAESILDRLVNAAFHVPMPGRSYRATQRPTATGRSGQRS